jgi:hypothetical protein
MMDQDLILGQLYDVHREIKISKPTHLWWQVAKINVYTFPFPVIESVCLQNITMPKSREAVTSSFLLIDAIFNYENISIVAFILALQLHNFIETDHCE